MSFEWNKSETERGPERSYRINTKGVNYRSKDVTQVQQQRPESPSLTLTWHTCYTSYINSTRDTSSAVHQHVPVVEYMYLVFTRMPGESYRRRLRSLLLCLCDVFRALINSLV